MVRRCDLMGVRNATSDAGPACMRAAVTQCWDCDIALCESHKRTCLMCGEVFCSSCLSFHQAEHAKPAAAVRHNRREPKTA
jgi:hypothetical protein